jgi:hypothetical protein
VQSAAVGKTKNENARQKVQREQFKFEINEDLLGDYKVGKGVLFSALSYAAICFFFSFVLRLC